MSFKQNQVFNYILSFILPIISLVIAYFLIGIFPFGNLSILTTDLNNQYLSFFSYFSDFLNGEANLFYSLSKGMGGEMIGLIAYYLFSPFNLILYFANLNTLPTFILIITLLKIGSAGLSMFYFLSRKTPSIAALLLAVPYALIGYNIVYQQNIMWLDGVILLPLVISGIDNILKQKSYITYTIFLSLAIITNYYIGFMLCIFSVLYFLVNYFRIYGLKKILKKKQFKIWANFSMGSFLAGLLSAFITIPTLYSFKGGSAGFDLEQINFTFNFNIIDFLSKFYIGAHNFEQLKAGFPNIYVSIFIVALVMFFFLSKGIKRKEKASYFILLGSLLVSFVSSGIDLFWHGLNVPNWYPYRYSFIMSFILILIASKILTNMVEKKTDIKMGHLMTVIVLSIMISIIIYTIDYEYLSSFEIIISIIFFILYCIQLYFFNKKRPFQYALLLGIIFVELTFNNFSTLKEIDFASHEKYQDSVTENEPIFDKLKNDNQFYRIEKTYHYSQNDPLLLNYNGLSHYSTTSKENEKKLLGKMGYNNQNIWAMYSGGSTIPADSLFGVKYILTDDKTADYYELIENHNGIHVYENPYALPLGFLVSHDIYTPINSGDPLDYQNKVYRNLGFKEPIFTKVSNDDIQIKLDNVDFKMVGDLYRYGKIDTNKEGTINFYINNDEKDLINFYFNIMHYDQAEIYVDDVYIGRDFDQFSHTVNVAQSNKETVKITIKLLSEQLRYKDVYFYRQNNETFLHYIKKLKKNPLVIEYLSDSYIKGEIIGINKTNKLLLTIPYDGAWSIKINGEQAELTQAFNGLLSATVPEGRNTIELSYRPYGLVVGIVVSILSLVYVMFYGLKVKKKATE